MPCSSFGCVARALPRTNFSTSVCLKAGKFEISNQQGKPAKSYKSNILNVFCIVSSAGTKLDGVGTFHREYVQPEKRPYPWIWILTEQADVRNPDQQRQDPDLRRTPTAHPQRPARSESPLD